MSDALSLKEDRINPFDEDNLGLGRPSKIHDENVRKAFTGAIIVGASINQAASLAGINPSTFRRWRQAAKEGKEPYLSFLEEMQMAQDRAIARKLQVIDNAAQGGTWQAAAWWLERNFPDQYALVNRTEVTGKDGEDIVVKLQWPD